MKKILLGIFIGLIWNCVDAGAQVKNAELEGLLSRHLRSIGPEAVLAGVKTRVAEGTSHYKVVMGGPTGTVDLDGKAALVSEGQQVRMLLRFSDPRYPGENYVTDGKKVQVYNLPRSGFGELVYNEEPLMRDGLLGGVLTTAWPFFSQDRRRAKLTYAGLAEIDGKKLHEIKYQPQKRSDLKISFYFDPDTSRHVLSIYTVELAPKMLGTDFNRMLQQAETNPLAPPPIETNSQSQPDMANSRQQTIRFRLEERFSEFRDQNGLTLPIAWNIRLTMEGYQSTIVSWDVKFERLEFNLTLDPRNFSMK